MKVKCRTWGKWAMASLTLVLCLDTLAGTTLYRWLNDRGEPIYSDRPPPKGVNYEVVATESSLKRVVAAEEGAVPLETNPRVGNEFTQVDPTEATRYKKNPELCQRGRTNLASLTSSEKVKVRDANGEERYLSPEEMEVERETAKAQIKTYCESG